MSFLEIFLELGAHVMMMGAQLWASDLELIDSDCDDSIFDRKAFFSVTRKYYPRCIY